MRRIGSRDLDVDQLPESGDDLLAEGDDVFLVHEAGLDVQLGELRLPVRAEVLVPVAAGNLVVLLEAAHLQELLEQLRGLRQGVPGTGGQARRHQEVTGAFRRGAGQRGGLDFHVALLVQQLTGHPVGFAAQADVALHAGPAQVQVAVLEPGFLTDFHVLVNLEWQRCGLVEHDDLLRYDLDLAGGQVRVLVALRPLLDRADHLQHVLVAQGVEDFLLAHHNLGDAGGVAQVQERHTAMVATSGNPTGEGHSLSDVLGPQGAKVMCAQHSIPFRGGSRGLQAAAAGLASSLPGLGLRMRWPDRA